MGRSYQGGEIVSQTSDAMSAYFLSTIHGHVFLLVFISLQIQTSRKYRL
jgi:hypothetical protein